MKKKLVRCIEKVSDLPSLPSITIKALSLSLEEDVDIKGLTKVIESDPALVVTILKRSMHLKDIVQKKISDISHAISLIGISDLQCILLSNISFSFLEKQKKR